MKTPKYKINDTIVLKRRWFWWWRDYVMCQVVFGRWVDEIYELGDRTPQWRYTLRIGNQLKRFCMWEEDLITNKK